MSVNGPWLRARAMLSAQSSRKPSIWRRPRRRDAPLFGEGLRGGGCPETLRLADAPLPTLAIKGMGFDSHHIIPPTVIHIDRQHRHPVVARIADDLRGGVKPHRLGIQQSGGKHCRVVAFDPGGGMDQMRKGLRMAFGKAVCPNPSICLKQRAATPRYPRARPSARPSCRGTGR